MEKQLTTVVKEALDGIREGREYRTARVRRGYEVGPGRLCIISYPEGISKRIEEIVSSAMGGNWSAAVWYYLTGGDQERRWVDQLNENQWQAVKKADAMGKERSEKAMEGFVKDSKQLAGIEEEAQVLERLGL